MITLLKIIDLVRIIEIEIVLFSMTVEKSMIITFQTTKAVRKHPLVVRPRNLQEKPRPKRFKDTSQTVLMKRNFKIVSTHLVINLFRLHEPHQKKGIRSSKKETANEGNVECKYKIV